MPEKSDKNRLSQLGADSQLINMPKCETRIVEYWMKAGQAGLSGGSISPLSFAEIKACIDLLGLRLSPFDCRAVKLMSDSYCSWIVKGRNSDCKAPYLKDERTQEQKNKEIADKLRSMAKRRRKQ